MQSYWNLEGMFLVVQLIKKERGHIQGSYLKLGL